MAALTDVSLASQALLLLGENEIESFDADENPQAATAGTLYNSLVNGWLSSYPWTFCKTKIKLARDTAAPISTWAYAFQLPADRLNGGWAVYNTDGLNARPISNFDIQGQKLLANDTDIWIDYTYRAPEAYWPPYFVIFAINALAAALALPATQDKSLADRYDVLAFGSPSDNRKGGLYGEATKTDALSRPNDVIYDSPLIDARW